MKNTQWKILATILISSCTSFKKFTHNLAGTAHTEYLTNEEKHFYQENVGYLSNEAWQRWLFEEDQEKRKAYISQYHDLIAERRAQPLYLECTRGRNINENRGRGAPRVIAVNRSGPYSIDLTLFNELLENKKKELAQRMANEKDAKRELSDFKKHQNHHNVTVKISEYTIEAANPKYHEFIVTTHDGKSELVREHGPDSIPAVPAISQYSSGTWTGYNIVRLSPHKHKLPVRMRVYREIHKDAFDFILCPPQK